MTFPCHELKDAAISDIYFPHTYEALQSQFFLADLC